MSWWCYLLECSDGTLYCGATNDLEKRVETHNAKCGAKYTRTRTPVRLLASWEFENKSAALKEEHRIKGLTREQKLELIRHASEV